MSIVAASFAYPRLDTDKRGVMAARIAGRPPLPGTFLLATCLRIEVAIDGTDQDMEDTLITMFGHGGFPPPELLHGEAAVRHLFRTAAGLESPILGEAEILTQFRQALADSKEAGLPASLAKLLEAAISTGRRAREYLPGSAHDSMAAVAAQVVGGSDRVVVVGSGTMARALIPALRGLPAPPAVTLLARRPEDLELDRVDVWSLDRLTEAMTSFPAVISATAAASELLSKAEMGRILAVRRTPLTLIDMAMPPDFTPPASTLLRHVVIDDLARMAERRPRSREADALVATATTVAHQRYVSHAEVGPVIGDLLARADGIVDETVERFAGRLSDAADAAVLRQATHTVVRKLLASPLAYLNDPEQESDAAATISQAFGLDRE